jgi:hypothetical protein
VKVIRPSDPDPSPGSVNEGEREGYDHQTPPGSVVGI